MKQFFTINRKLSFLIPIFAVIASLTGILKPGIYDPRLNSISSGELLGQDTVSLIVGIVLFICLLFEKGRFILKVVNLGMIAYFLYVYCYFCFSIISGVLFLLYIAIFGFSLFIFIFRLSSLIKENETVITNVHYPRKGISIFFIAAVLIMLIMEIPYLVETTILKNNSTILFDAYYILDLAFVFPAMIIIAVFNLYGKPPGTPLSGIVLVKMISLLPALILNDVFHYLNEGSFIDISFDIIALIFTLLSLVFFILYIQGIDKKLAGN